MNWSNLENYGERKNVVSKMTRSWRGGGSNECGLIFGMFPWEAAYETNNIQNIPCLLYTSDAADDIGQV